MKRTLSLFLVPCLFLGSSLMVGCSSEEAGVKSETTATGPGGTTTTTSETKVETTGENPPPAEPPTAP